MGKILSQEEIKQRLLRLSNLERLHGEQKARLDFLEKELALKDKIIEQQNKIIEDLKLQLEELKIKVYGRKKDRDDDDNNPKPPKDKVIRTKKSYRRPIPKEGEVTEARHYGVDFCPDCGAKIINKKTTVFYEEDIPIAIKKKVIRHEVEKGYCPYCKVWHRASQSQSNLGAAGSEIYLLSFLCLPLVFFLCAEPAPEYLSNQGFTGISLQDHGAGGHASASFL